MTGEQLRTRLDYPDWALGRLLEALAPLTPEQFTRDLGSSFRSLRDTVAHTTTKRIWSGHAPARCGAGEAHGSDRVLPVEGRAALKRAGHHLRAPGVSVVSIRFPSRI